MSAQYGTRWRAGLPLIPVLLFLVAFMVYPVGRLLIGSLFTRDGSLTLEYYQRLLTGEVYFQVLLITMKIAAWTTVFAVVFGYPVAYLIATSPDRSRARLMFWVLLPFWTSFLVRTFACVVLLGRHGAINQLVQALGLTDAPFELIYNFTSVIIGMSHGLMPLAIITMVAVMETIDRRLVRLRVRVLHTAPAHYGRRRVGCEVTSVAGSERARLAVMATMAASTDSAAERIAAKTA